MANGTVKWFNTNKGFGFIALEEGGKDVFVHISSLERSGLTGLADDQKVTFDVELAEDGCGVITEYPYIAVDTTGCLTAEPESEGDPWRPPGTKGAPPPEAETPNIPR